MLSKSAMGSIRHAKRQDDECHQIAPLQRDVAGTYIAQLIHNIFRMRRVG